MVQQLTRIGLGLAVALALLAAVELALRLLGVGEGTRAHDPFVGFSNQVPMFAKTLPEDGVPIYRTVPARGARIPEEFLAEKPAGGFRVFVVGGSSAAGTPYGYDYAFGSWLERRLAAEVPQVHTEVVNAAIDAYATKRILMVVRELASYEPDLLIVYSGHNEHSEGRYYEHLTQLDPRLFRLWSWLTNLRIFSVIEQLVAPEVLSPKPVEFGDRKNVLEYFGVAAERMGGKFATEREREYQALHYRDNLEQMIESMRSVGAQVMLVTLSQNFADWPPAASSHRAGLTEAERKQWETLVAEGDQLVEDDCEGALGRYRRALAIDDEHAGLHFKVADCERQQGRPKAASLHYRQASDLDRAFVGAPTSYNEILRELAAEHETLLVDVEALFQSRSPGGLVGDDLFTDPAHPNLLGHQWIAAAIATALREAGLPEPADGWTAGAYQDPPVEALYQDDPELRLREGWIRALSCLLAHRRACALEHSEAVLAVRPSHEGALKLRDAALALPVVEAGDGPKQEGFDQVDERSPE